MTDDYEEWQLEPLPTNAVVLTPEHLEHLATAITEAKESDQ